MSQLMQFLSEHWYNIVTITILTVIVLIVVAIRRLNDSSEDIVHQQALVKAKKRSEESKEIIGRTRDSQSKEGASPRISHFEGSEPPQSGDSESSRGQRGKRAEDKSMPPQEHDKNRRRASQQHRQHILGLAEKYKSAERSAPPPVVRRRSTTIDTGRKQTTGKALIIGPSQPEQLASS